MQKLYYLIFGTVLIFPFVINAAFLDISNLSIYKDAVTFLKDRAIIEGYEDGTFKPENSINRAELTKILIESNKVELSNDQNCFPDVIGQEWYVKYVCTAKSLGWVEGYPDKTFKPAQYINRAEALKIIAKAENWNYSILNESQFSDVDINIWFGKFVAYAKSANFLPFDQTFKPAQFINRGEFSEIYYRILFSEENNLSMFPGFRSEYLEQGLDYEPAFFESIVLDSPFPSKFVQSEIYKFSGNVSTATLRSGTLAVFDNSGKIIQKYPFKISNSSFSVDVLLDTTGDFGIGIVVGDNSKTKIAKIRVLNYENFFKLNSELPKPQNLNLLDFDLEYKDQSTFLSYALEKTPQPVFIKFEFLQKGNLVTYYSRNLQNDLRVQYKDFVNFEEGRFDLNFYASNIGNNVASDWILLDKETFNAANHSFSEITSKVSDVKIPDFFKKDQPIKITGIAQDILDPDLFVILPNGLVEKIPGDGNYIRTGKSFEFNYIPRSLKPHIFEINNANGLAVINYTIYPEGTIPLIPDYFDLNQLVLQTDLKLDEEIEVDKLLDLINTDRQEFGFQKVKLDSKLSDLAENHNLDMLENNFFGHINLEGETPNDRRLKLNIDTPVGENIAKVLSVESGHENLMRSAIHRRNILDPIWNRVGLSIKKNIQGFVYIVQQFSFTNSYAKSFIEDNLLILNPNLSLDSNLVKYSEYWNENMLENNFFSTSNGSETIFDQVDSNLYSGLKSAILKGADLDLLVAEISATTDIKSTEWTKFGFGVDYNHDGTIFITLIWGK